jgi:hypothetical protein
MTKFLVIIFDEYQKSETVNLRIRTTFNVLLNRNPRNKLRKDFIFIITAPAISVITALVIFFTPPIFNQ